MNIRFEIWLAGAVALGSASAPAATNSQPPRLAAELDAPLLFVKRQPYFSDHIYDDYYTWHPGGGIYVIENPSAPRQERKVRAVIDPTTRETLGEGVYRDPDLSWDATRILFAFKGARDGDTAIYEIGLDGRGLRQLTQPALSCQLAPPKRALGKGHHDISPAYLPDGRIVFTSTRQGGRVPCFNSEVDTLHVMNADGSGAHPISVNNVNEFDPAVLPDGRVLYGRWEYVDKTALYLQSLWVCHPDGSHEEAFFGNNMARPTAFLDARPVPGSHLVVASLTPHNGQSVGAIAMIDTHLGKNGLHAIHNFTPEHPTEMDQGLKRGPCDPWPLSPDLVLIANNATNYKHGVLELIARDGRREVVHGEPDISCYSPMLVKPRAVPPVLPSHAQPGQPGRFLVEDIYRGLDGVARGSVKKLRVLEETARISGIPGGGRWWNQAFLVSWQGAYTVKNFLGVVPVHEDGSAYFEAPPGRALYLQALDGDGRLVQSMRTFVQATPGVTRSCVGCHESKASGPMAASRDARALQRQPSRLQPESWGSGFVDYPTMIQPILDRHCVRCHGGPEGIAAGMDLSGGWTWAFNLSYETLLKNTQSGFLNCVNEAVKTAEILPPRTHGSGVAPLGRLLLQGHGGRLPQLTRSERDLLMAWMDGNCNYLGTWDWTEHATCNAILDAGNSLASSMKQSGCTRCHEAKVGNDWINLQRPEWSRMLRAPMAASSSSLALGWCRERKARAVLPLVKQTAQPPDVFAPKSTPPPHPGDAVAFTFVSTADTNYQAMLAIIRRARAEALAEPRVDMPGAGIEPGECRQLVTLGLPEKLPGFRAAAQPDGAVELTWERSAPLIGLSFELHRGRVGWFTPRPETRLGRTSRFSFLDTNAGWGRSYYALVPVNQNGRRSAPVRTSVHVNSVAAPSPPAAVRATAHPGECALEWDAPGEAVLRYDIYRSSAGQSPLMKLNSSPITTPFFTDREVSGHTAYRYAVRTVNRIGLESPPTTSATITALPERREPVFTLSFAKAPAGRDANGNVVAGKRHGGAQLTEEGLDLRAGGHATFPHQPEFDLAPRFAVECRVHLEAAGESPVLLSCGQYDGAGWFLQRFGSGWRWHLGGTSCDGGQPALNRWIHLRATFDGRRARLFQDGVEVASVPCAPNRARWDGPLFVGQYSAPGPNFQVKGRITDVKIYHSASPATPLAAARKP